MRKERKTYVMGIIIVAIFLIVLSLIIGVWSKEKRETYNVIFKDYNGDILKEEMVTHGKSAHAPNEPSRTGYVFKGWDKDFSVITKDIIISAEYSRITKMMFTVDTITVSPDVRNVEVKISVMNNPGILGMTLSLNYDEEAMKLIACQNGVALSALAFQEPSQYVNGCNFVWYGSETGEVMDGEMLILTFEVAENAKPGTYPVSVSWNDRDIYDSNCDMLDPDVTQGAIVVSE